MRLYHPYKVADRRPCPHRPRRSCSRERSCRRSTFVVSMPQPHPKNCIAHPKNCDLLAPHSIYLINQRCADCVCRLVGGDTGMMTGIEIVFFLLYCGLAVALALWASRVRMRSATPFSLTKLAFGHIGKGSAVPVAAVRAVALHGNTEPQPGMRFVAPPRPGPDHRPTNGGHCGGDGSVLRFRAVVAMTNWRGLQQPHALL